MGRLNRKHNLQVHVDLLIMFEVGQVLEEGWFPLVSNMQTKPHFSHGQLDIGSLSFPLYFLSSFNIMPVDKGLAQKEDKFPNSSAICHD